MQLPPVLLQLAVTLAEPDSVPGEGVRMDMPAGAPLPLVPSGLVCAHAPLAASGSATRAANNLVNDATVWCRCRSGSKPSEAGISKPLLIVG